MDVDQNPLRRLLDLLPPGGARDFLSGPGGWVVLGVAALVVLLMVLAVLRRLWRALFALRPAPALDIDRDLSEDLADLPLAGPAGSRQLTVEGVPVRVRLVVVAPHGRQNRVDADAVPALLDQVIHGLGAVLGHDRPRLRVWPPQLSTEGFAVKFHRLTVRPEPDGRASHWVLLAGETPARPRPLLVGLALWAPEANHIGRLTLDAARWADVLRVRPTED